MAGLFENGSVPLIRNRAVLYSRTRGPVGFAGLLVALVAVLSTAACTGQGEAGVDASGDSESVEAEQASVVALTGATLHSMTPRSQPIGGAVVLVEGGRVLEAGPADEVQIPAGAEVIDLTGLHLLPGLINAHGHIAGVRGLESGPQFYTRDNLVRQLDLSARYGVTTVVSLGGDGPEGAQLREEQDAAARSGTLDRARIFIAGPVLSPRPTDDVPAQMDRLEGLDPEWVKIRVDDQLGRGTAMDGETYASVIRAASGEGLPLAAHVVREEDALGVVTEGARVVAHSVRDAPMSADLLGMMAADEVCLTPTLTREVSVFVYGERPDFFDDPFFLEHADPEVLEELQDPERQARVRASEAADWYREGLQVALDNLILAHEAGVPIAMGTDSGPPARFQGYFEHMEMEMMADAGMAPIEVLRSATATAARCMGLEDLGTVEAGAWADFLIVRDDPSADIRALREIEAVWIGGRPAH